MKRKRDGLKEKRHLRDFHYAWHCVVLAMIRLSLNAGNGYHLCCIRIKSVLENLQFAILSLLLFAARWS